MQHAERLNFIVLNGVGEEVTARSGKPTSAAGMQEIIAVQRQRQTAWQ